MRSPREWEDINQVQKLSFVRSPDSRVKKAKKKKKKRKRDQEEMAIEGRRKLRKHDILEPLGKELNKWNMGYTLWYIETIIYLIKKIRCYKNIPNFVQ